jgi:hypothetical protein
MAREVKAVGVDPIEGALNARVFKKLGVSPHSRWARHYAEMMRRPLTAEEWRNFEENVLNDPKKLDEWVDRVVVGWTGRTSTGSRKRLTASKSR